MLRLLHLSDIHFNKKQGVNDDNIEVRHAIEKDLKLLMTQDGRKIDYILVCGDIAFSGKKMEYDKAKDWLDTICKIVKCKESSVLLVPGNHDVDRADINNCYIQKMIHENIKSQNVNEIDKTFENLFDNNHLDILKIPQTNYNDFASIYECNVENNKLFWELKHEDFSGYQIIFRGCNSALLADEHDDTVFNKMVLSKQQYYIKDDFKTINIVLCHHPIECLIDKHNVNQSFSNKSSLQLYGHNHKFHVEEKEKSLIVHAGAIKLAAEELGEPCYNIIDIDINNVEFNTSLYVKIWIREWNGNRFISGVDNEMMFDEYTIPLNENSDLWTIKNKKDKIDNQITDIQTINKLIESEDGVKNYTERDVRYKFLTMSFREKRRIGNAMIQDIFQDSNKSEMARSLEFLNKIKEENRYNELWNNIKS